MMGAIFTIMKKPKNPFVLQKRAQKIKLRKAELFQKGIVKKANFVVSTASDKQIKERNEEIQTIEKTITTKFLIETIKEKRQELYQQYLETNHWKILSNLKLKIDNYSCKKCRSSKNLQVYHTSYNKMCKCGELDDLITLCGKCNKKYNEVRIDSF